MNTCYSKMLNRERYKSCSAQLQNLTPVPTQSTLRSFLSAQNAQLHKLPHVRNVSAACSFTGRFCQLPANTVHAASFGTDGWLRPQCEAKPLGGVGAARQVPAARALLDLDCDKTRHKPGDLVHSPKHVQPSRCIACPCTHLRRLVAR